MTWYLITGIAVATMAAILFTLTLFADELVRFATRTIVPSPIWLPKGAEIRCSPWLVKLFGFGAKGGAAAVTVGNTILVPHYAIIESMSTVTLITARLPNTEGATFKLDAPLLNLAQWKRLIAHERVHVQQRIRLGRVYLSRYSLGFVWAFIWHGRSAHEFHPMEIEARTIVKRQYANG